MMRAIHITVLFILLHPAGLSANDHQLPPCIDLINLTRSERILKRAGICYIDFHDTLVNQFPSLQFLDGSKSDDLIPRNMVMRKAILQFRLCNSGNRNQSVWFFPGLYFQNISLYKRQGNAIQAIPDILPDHSDETSYRLISVAPLDTLTVVAELSFLRTHLNRIQPTLIHSAYFSAFVNELEDTDGELRIVTILFCGLLLMMIFYSLANYIQGGHPEFLYYSGYALCLGLMLFIKAVFDYHSTEFNFFQETFLDLILQNGGILMYILFMQRFLNTRNKYPFLFRLYRMAAWVLVISTAAFTVAHFFTEDFVLENLIESSTKFLLLALVAIFLVYGIRHRGNRLLRYVFWGNLLLLVFSLISLFISNLGIVPGKGRGLFSSALFYYELGLMFELIFFLLGLTFKHNDELIREARETERLRAAEIKNDYEKQFSVYQAQQQERDRISADMHDELGSGMTAIRLMSEIARNKMKENTPPEIHKISESANEVLNNMNAILWSMSSVNDSLDNLVSYIRSFALEYFENTSIQCRIITPEQIPTIDIAGDKRRNLFLSVKETLSNVLRHSDASEITIEFRIDHLLQVKIKNNGHLKDPGKSGPYANSLTQIAKRLNSIGGTFDIESNEGTTSIFTVPL